MEEFDFKSLEDDNAWFEIVDGDDERFAPVNDIEIYDQSRWSVSKHVVVREESTGFFYEILWDMGSTEYQDGQEHNFTVARVYPHRVLTTVYKTFPEG